LVQHFDVLLDSIGSLDHLLDSVPTSLGILALVKNIEQFFSLSGIEIQTITTHKLQCVPLPRIVTCSDRDAAVSLQPLHCELYAWRWANTKVDNFTTYRQQTRQHSRANHLSRRPRVATNKNSSPVQVCSKALGKLDRQLRGEGFTDNSPHAGDADFQRFHRNFLCLNFRKLGCQT